MNKRLKVIACNVVRRELEWILSSEPTLSLSPEDIEFIELGEHARPNALRELLQKKIDAVSSSGRFDAIALAYGLCGRSTDRLVARELPLVLPRVHDCRSLLLGSAERFDQYFADQPSSPFSSIGYVEFGEYYFQDGQLKSGDLWNQMVEKYGEENARYIYDALHPKHEGKLLPIYFISSPGLDCNKAREKAFGVAQKEGRPFRDLVGDRRLLDMLLSGHWSEEEFLIVPPQSEVVLSFEKNVIYISQPHL